MNSIFDVFAEYHQAMGLVTFIICVVGFVLISLMQRYFEGSQHELSQKMARVYRWDAFKFGITSVFGLAGFINAPSWFWHVAYSVRPFILIMLIWALYDLFKTFKKISKN